MKKYQKIMIIGLLVLALVPGFIGVASAAPHVQGTCYVDDGTHTSTAKAYGYTPLCQIQYCSAAQGCLLTTATAQGTWGTTLTVGKPWTISVLPPTGWSWTGPVPVQAYTVTPALATDVITLKDFWLTPLTAPVAAPASITGAIDPGASETDTITVTTGSEQITQAQWEYGGEDPHFGGVTSVPSGPMTIAPGVSQPFDVTIQSTAGVDPGTYSFSIKLWDKNYYGSGLNRLVLSIPVTKTVPAPVPVPEFPTIAVSILTISGMVIAVQFIKKRN